MHIYCDAPKPGGPLTTRQPAEYKWTSGYPTPLQKIGQSLLCTGSSTQIQYLYITCIYLSQQSNICNIYQIWPLGPITVLDIHADYESNYIRNSYKSYYVLLSNNTYIKIREILIHVQPPKPHPGFLHNKSLGRAVLSHAPCTCKIKGGSHDGVS